jgi:hypothetical protein
VCHVTTEDALFETELANLATAVRAAVVRRKQRNEVVTKRSAEVRRRDLTLKYSGDFGFANFAPERFEQEDSAMSSYRVRRVRIDKSIVAKGCDRGGSVT